jgi:glycosyltransferase involved in cell wall biosynthesis
MNVVESKRTDAPRKTKVCHVVATADGATWMYEQLRELRDRYGFDVTAVVSGDRGGLVDRLRAERIPFYVWDFEFTGAGQLRHLPRKILGLARLFRRERFDVVQTHLFHSMVIGRLAAWLADVPVRLAMVAGPFHLEAYTPRWIDRSTCWMDTTLIASCEYSRMLYRAMGVADRRLALIYYGPDERGFEPSRTPPAEIRAEYGWEADTPVVGMVAYFYPRLGANRWTPLALHCRAIKGHECLIRAAPLVLREFPNARFLFVGGGWGDAGEEHMREMRTLASELGLDGRVVFAGFRRDVPSLLRALDVSVQPSLNENLGGTIESLLMECPTVATRVGGMTDSVRDGITGLLADPADPADLARAITQLLRDREQARALGRAGRQLMLERFTLARTAGDLANLYERLLSRAATSMRGYRPWVVAYRLVLLLPMSAYLALRLQLIDASALPLWDAGYRPWRPKSLFTSRLALDYLGTVLGRLPTSFGLRAKCRGYLSMTPHYFYALIGRLPTSFGLRAKCRTLRRAIRELASESKFGDRR